MPSDPAHHTTSPCGSRCPSIAALAELRSGRQRLPLRDVLLWQAHLPARCTWRSMSVRWSTHGECTERRQERPRFQSADPPRLLPHRLFDHTHLPRPFLLPLAFVKTACVCLAGSGGAHAARRRPRAFLPAAWGGKCMCSRAELKTVFRLSRRRHRPRMCSIGLGYSSKSRLTHLFVTVGALRTTAAALARALLAMPSSLALGPAQSTPAQRPPPCTAWSMSAATV